MRWSLLLPLGGLIVLWAVAISFWGGLPERLPMHFDLAGVPDRWVERTPWNWFLLPGMATALAGLFGAALPAWVLALAASNSPYLNVPRKADFVKLSPAARVRAMQPMVALLDALAGEIALLFTGMLWATRAVADGTWSRLPPLLVWIPIALILLTTLGAIPFASAAVGRELERARA